MKYSRDENTAADGLVQLSEEYIKKTRNIMNIYNNGRSEKFTNMTKDALLHRIKSKLMRMKVNDVKRIYRSIAQS